MSSHVKTFVYVWAALLVLLGATVAVTLIGVGPFAPVFNIGIAIAKMLLVVWFFMHLRNATGLTALVAGAGLFWLILLFALGLNDWLTRDWMNPAVRGFETGPPVQEPAVQEPASVPQ